MRGDRAGRHLPAPFRSLPTHPSYSSDGRRLGLADGAALGAAHGFAIGRELGAALGSARAATTLAVAPGGPRISDRATKAAAALEGLVAAVPLRDPQAPGLTDALDAVRAKKRALDAALQSGGGVSVGGGGARQGEGFDF